MTVLDDSWACFKIRIREYFHFKTFGCWVLFDLEARSLNEMTHWTYKNTVPSPWVISKPHFKFREMISLFLLIFAFENGLATGQVTLNDLQMTMNGMNDKINKLELQALKSKFKIYKVKSRNGSFSWLIILITMTYPGDNFKICQDICHQYRWNHIWHVDFYEPSVIDYGKDSQFKNSRIGIDCRNERAGGTGFYLKILK